MTSVNKMTIGKEKKENFIHLRIGYMDQLPEHFTGVAEYPDGSKCWRKDGLLHREDGPAVEFLNGYKEWYKEGNLHREDGPAVEWLDGSKFWHKNGKYHRENGPAVEFSNGTKHWYKNGDLHREDGPAREWTDGYKNWYLEGKKYSEEEWKLKVQELKEPRMKVLKLKDLEFPPQDFTGIAEFPSGSTIWYKNGLRHREDGPAVEWANGDKEWWAEGKRHREDGPAIENKNEFKSWWIEGESYSEHNWKLKVQELKEPKMEVLKLKDHECPPKDFTGIAEFPSGTKIWYKQGAWHREDGPAIEWANGTKEWWVEGKRHREDGPAKEWSDGHKEWWVEGKLHREDGPAVEFADGTKHWWIEGENYSEEGWKLKVQELKEPKMRVLKLEKGQSIPKNFTGIVEFLNGAKIWYKQGKWHREDGAAKIWKSGDKEWWIEGKLHRDDGPACEYANGDKNWYLEGKSYSEEEWKVKVQELKEPKMKVLKLKSTEYIPAKYTGLVEWSDGVKTFHKEEKFHREDGPAIEFPNGTKKWYKDNLLHRLDGPAIDNSDGSKLWYKEGKLHREDGPAIENSNGTKEWYKDNFLHREDGPAIEYSNGIKYWYLEGKKYSKEEFSRATATKRDPLTATPAVVKSEPTTASKPEKQESTTSKEKETPEMTSMDKAKAIILSDASIVAQRVAVEQIAKQIQNMIVGLLVSKQKGRQKTAMKTQLEEFFSSKAGSAAIKFIAGLALPRVAEYASKYGLLKPQHLVVVETLATELRIQGETDAALEVMEALSPLVSMLTSGLTAQLESMMNSFVEAPVENLRIDVGGNQNQTSQVHEMEPGFVSQKAATG